jgi:hypothetical protein
MPNTKTDVLDARIDRYVRRKMSADEELEFESDYLDQPDVIAKIEEIQLLQGILKNVRQSATEPEREPEQEREQSRPKVQLVELFTQWKKMLRYLTVPQTAWGALAATLMIMPVLLLLTYGHKESAIGTTSVYLLESITVRGDDTTGNETTKERIFSLTLEKAQKNIVLGFVVEPNLGPPATWTMEVVNEQNQSIWIGEKLSPDFQSVIYINIETHMLKDKRYLYHLRSGSHNTIEGAILINRE